MACILCSNYNIWDLKTPGIPRIGYFTDEENIIIHFTWTIPEQQVTSR